MFKWKLSISLALIEFIIYNISGCASRIKKLRIERGKKKIGLKTFTDFCEPSLNRKIEKVVNNILADTSD